MWVCGFEQKEYAYIRLCHSVCNISEYMYMMEWMPMITTWNCHPLSTQTLWTTVLDFSYNPTRCVQRMWPAWILPTWAWHLTSVRHKRTTKADVMVRCAAWYDHGSIVPLKMSAAVGTSKKVWAAIQWNNWTRITWNIVMHALGPSPKKPLISHIYVYTHRGYEYISSCST